MRESIHHGGKRNVRWEAVGEYQHYNRTGMERLHSKCVYRLYFKEFWKRNLYIKDWVNMKTAKNKYKHKKKKNFKPKQQTHYIEERKKPDARLKTCSKEVDEMEYPGFTDLEALELDKLRMR